MRLGGPQNRSGRGGEVKNSQLLQGLEPPIIQPVTSAITLNYPGSLYYQNFVCILYFFHAWISYTICLGKDIAFQVLIVADSELSYG
jgi:hypothetical protein